jgi:hypothetical protein
VNARERKVVEALVEAGEALHRADGLLGRIEEWRLRWQRHVEALAEARKIVPDRPSSTPSAGATP